MQSVPNLPQASALIQSLRDIGYELDTALADIIDNSITANASQVEIKITTAPALSIAIIDNGDGMTQDELINAMRIGSSNPLLERNENDLGRFGLGLKTASFSQCKKLTVISKQNGIACSAMWDLDEITDTNQWHLNILEPHELQQIEGCDDLGEKGTLVLWEKCDRIIDVDTPDVNDVYKKLEDAEYYLSLVYHRFLDRTYRTVANLNITINSRAITFVDPFFSNHLATQTLQKEYICYKSNTIAIQGFTLPHHAKCTPKEYEKHKLQRSYRDTQGFYVYRADRLVIYGTWFRLLAKTDLTNLTRVAIDIPNSLDSDWHIDIKKSHARPPKDIRDQLKNYIQSDKFTSSSKRVYTSKGHRKSTTTVSVWSQETKHNLTSYRLNLEHGDFADFMHSLDPDSAKRFKNIVELIETCLPLDQIFSQYASNPKDFDQKSTDDRLEELAREKLTIDTVDPSILLAFLETTEPYCHYKKSWQTFLTQAGDQHEG